MTNKNSPLRIIDQKSTSTTPPPNAVPTRYNPYTGGVIRQSREAGYKIFLQSSTSWVKTTFTIFTENNRTFARRITFSVRIPKLTVRIINANVDINKLRVFLSFDKGVFDNYDDDEFKVPGDPIPNITSFVTTSVTHVGPSNRTVGVYDATNNIRALFLKYTVLEILRASGVDIDLTELRTLSDDEIKDLFYGSMYSLRVYGQAMYQDLSPDNSNTSSEFLFRVPVSTTYYLTPDQLRGADISDVVVSYENNNIVLRFRQIALKSLDIEIYDISTTNTTTVTNRLYSARHSSGTNDFSDTKVVVSIPITAFSNFKQNSVFSGFSSSTTPLINLNNLYNLNSRYQVRLTRVESNANVAYTGNDITTNYNVPTDYTVDSPAFNESVRMFYDRHIIDLSNGSWNYLLTTASATPFAGILVVYEILINNQTRFVPRFRSPGQLAAYTDYIEDSKRYISVNDFFFGSGENTSRIDIAGLANFNRISKVHFIPVSRYGRLSQNSFVYNYPTLDLRRNLENTALLGGYYNKMFIRDSQSLVLQSPNAFRPYSPLTQVRLDVKIEVYLSQGNSWTLLRINSLNKVFKIRVGRNHVISNYYGLFDSKDQPINAINSETRPVRGSRYRFQLVPVIPAAYIKYVSNSSYVYFEEFTAT
jgi:hypothetical protein